MLDHIPAVFRDGAFYPEVPCALPENSAVTLTVQPARLQSPLEPDAEKRREIMNRLTERMMQRQLAPDAPRLSREELHERP